MMIIPPAKLDKEPCNAKPNATPTEAIKAEIEAVSIPIYPIKQTNAIPFKTNLMACVDRKSVV